MSKWFDQISCHGKWDCDSDLDCLDGKWEGSPVERVIKALNEGEPLSGKIEFSNYYKPGNIVWYDHETRTWSWQWYCESYTFSETEKGSYTSFDWLKAYRDFKGRNDS